MGKKSGKEKSVIIIKNIIVTVLVIAFFVSVLIAFYNMLYEEKRNNIIYSGEMAASMAADQIDKYLSTNIDSIKLSAFTLDEMIRENKSDTEIQDFLVGQSTAIRSAVLENSTGLYGYINGRFFSGTNWEPPEGYDATIRPWYTKPLANSGKITMLDPYIDVQSGNVMLAVGKTLTDGKSVVSVDISLDKIQQIIEEAVTSGESDVEMIINDKGIVVAHSDISEAGKDYNTEKDTFGADLLEELNRSDSNYFEFYYNDLHYIVYAAGLMDNWHCVSVKDATAVFNPLRLVLGLTVSAVIIAVIVISAIMISSNSRQLAMERLSKQLSATADIYISMHEIDFLTDTFTEVRNNKTEASTMIGETRNHCQEMIRTIMTKFCDESSREAVLDFVDFSMLNMRLKNRNTITLEWLSADKKWRRSRYIVSDRTPTGIVARAMYLIEDIDAEKSERDMTLEAVKMMNEQISSVANIYFSMHDIDLNNDTSREIKTNALDISDLVGGSKAHAQSSIYEAMDRMTDKSCIDTMHAFVDFSTLPDRLKGNNTITEEFLSRDGIWRRARFVVSKYNDDGRSIAHILWLIESIDEEKRKRDKLTEAAEMLNARISSIANIYMTAHELDIKNDTFSEIKSDLNFVNDLIGETRTNAQATILKVMENITDESCIDDVRRFVDLSTLEKRMRKTDTITIEYMNNNKLWRRGRFVASKRDEKGKLVRVLWLSENINDEKMERDKLLDMSERAIAASEAKSSFLSNMSHEIRTPINAVLGMNEMILRESDDKNVLEYSESIRTAGNTLLGIVNDILDFSKIEAGKMEIIPVDYDLSSVINDLVNMIQTRADDKGLQVILKINRDIPRLLHGDEVRIKQVITNILTNAVKYTEKGSVTFSIEYEKIYSEPDSVNLNVEVMDTGIGIKPEDMKKLFSEFDRIDEERNRKVEGTGLGMSITKRLLEMMGSTLEVESVYELGSKFSFRLKQTVVKWEAIGDYEASYKASIGKREKYREKFRAPDAEILVVDDTPMNLTVFRSLLKKTGVKIDTAASGEEGLALAAHKKYDIVFLDHMMPDKDGIETLHELRSGADNPNRETPAICLTANAISGAREQYLSAGFDNYLTKPIDSAKLEEMLLEYLPEEKICEPGSEPLQTEDDDYGYDAFFEDEPKLPEFLSEIDEIDTEAGVVNCGSAEGYITALRTYAGMINDHADETEKFWQAGDLPNATIKIHAMKSTSRIIGAVSIGELAQELETAGKEGDAGKVGERIDELLGRCRKLGEHLLPLIGEADNGDDTDKPLISQEELTEAYALIKESAETYNFENIDEIVASLKDYSVPDAEKERVGKIIKAVSEFDYDKLPEILL